MSKANDTTAIDLIVSREESPMRLDRFLAERLAGFSRSRLQQLIRAGAATLNGKSARPRQLVRPGDRIRVTEPPVEKTEARAEAIPLDIIFEDDDLLVINKPAGLVVHPGAGNREHTLVNALLHYCRNLSGIGGKERPGIVHRLDKETSGCLVVAKNDETHRGLSAQFAGRTVDKVYRALVAGRLRQSSGTIEEKIGRHPVHRKRMSVASSRGRAAKTDYRVLKAGEKASLIECRLHSGRTHQIRVHLHHLGHPVLGDKLYSPQSAKSYDRQMLHASKLGFQHPRTNEWKEFEAPMPADFQEVMGKMGLA